MRHMLIGLISVALAILGVTDCCAQNRDLDRILRAPEKGFKESLNDKFSDAVEEAKGGLVDGVGDGLAAGVTSGNPLVGLVTGLFSFVKGPAKAAIGVSTATDIRELKEQAQRYELAFRYLDENMSRSLREFSNALDKRPTREEVNALLSALDRRLTDRMTELSKKFDADLAAERRRREQAEERQRQYNESNEAWKKVIDEKFAPFKHVNSTPLLRLADENTYRPRPHPLVKEWGELLCRSEGNFRTLQRKRAVGYRETSPELSKIKKESDRIIADTARFRYALNQALVDLLADRSRKLEDYEDNHSKVKAVDDMIGGLICLIEISQPNPKDPYANRLSVPRAFCRTDCTDYLTAFTLAGGDVVQFTSVFRDYLSYPMRVPRLPAAAANVSFDELQIYSDRRRSLSARLLRDVRLVRTHDQVVKQLGLQYGPNHPMVLGALRKKSAYLDEHRRLNDDIDAALDDASRAYVLALKDERPASPRMTRFRAEVLVPLNDYYLQTVCLNWDDQDHRQDVWRRTCKSVSYPVYSDMVFSGHGTTSRGEPAPAYAVAVAPDGRDVATAGWDGTVRLWNVTTGQEPRRLEGQRQPVWSLSYAPDGDRIAAAGEDGSVRIWDTVSGTQILSITSGAAGFARALYSVSFSPDGRALAAAGYDGKLRVWDAANGRLRAETEADRIVWSLSYALDGQTIATAGDSGAIKLWEGGDLRRGRPVGAHLGGALGIAYGAGDRLASCGLDQTIRIWRDGPTAGTRDSVDGRGHTYHVRCVAFSPDGELVASGGFDDTVRLWNARSGALLKTWESSHGGRVYGVTFTPDGRAVVSAGKDGRIRVRPVSEQTGN